MAELRGEDKILIRQRLNLPANSFIITCVGTIQHRKGQDLLISAMDELSERIQDCYLCLVAPPVTSMAHTTQDNAAAIKNSHRIILTGQRNDALDFIRAADVLVLASRAEAMPHVLLEAMALGTPVVASSVDGVTELIEDGRDGLLFPSEGTQSMIECLHRMAKNPELRRKLSTSAQERYHREFSRSLQVERYGAALLDLLH